MEILQAIWDKMGLSSKRFTTSFVVLLIAFPVLLIVTFIRYHQNSSFALFVGLSKSKEELGVREPNVTSNFPLEGSFHNNISDNNSGREEEGERYNNATSKVGDEFQNVTAATEGIAATSKNITSSKEEAGSKNDSKVHVAIPDEKDKLLHGLLASGFDEASCISRLQSHIYRKASPHKPSPYLISRLRNYEEIHTRCGPNTRAYNISMTEIVNNKGASVSASASASTSCKYVVWRPANGLGNQMLSIVATFLYAVLTDRVLLVKFGKDKQGLFCEPFLNSTWILPEKSPFWNVGKQVQKYQSMLEKDMANNTTSKENLLPSVLSLNLQHTRDDPEKFFHCDHSQDLLNKVPLLILRSDQYFVPAMFMTPFFNWKINKMFPQKDTTFHHLGRYLFHPSNEAWGLISRFYQEHLEKADERIGLQIRVFNPASTPQQAIMDLVLSCTKQHKLLPEVLIGMQNSVSSPSKNQTTKAVLVASLHPEYSENLRAMYLRKPTATGEIVEVYQASHEERQKFRDNMHNLKAWVDMYLLSLSDVLVTTSLSTFGYVAQGLGNLRPWLLYRLVSNETYTPPCERDFSMEPCYHIPPKHFCNGKPIEDFASSFLYMRKCKDYYSGVKLVNSSIEL